jgi:hypothetical protein
MFAARSSLGHFEYQSKPSFVPLINSMYFISVSLLLNFCALGALSLSSRIRAAVLDITAKEFSRPLLPRVEIYSSTESLPQIRIYSKTVWRSYQGRWWLATKSRLRNAITAATLNARLSSALTRAAINAAPVSNSISTV